MKHSSCILSLATSGKNVFHLIPAQTPCCTLKSVVVQCQIARGPLRVCRVRCQNSRITTKSPLPSVASSSMNTENFRNHWPHLGQIPRTSYSPRNVITNIPTHSDPNATDRCTYQQTRTNGPRPLATRKSTPTSEQVRCLQATMRDPLTKRQTTNTSNENKHDHKAREQFNF